MDGASYTRTRGDALRLTSRVAISTIEIAVIGLTIPMLTEEALSNILC